jgi:hypothetical protein
MRCACGMLRAAAVAASGSVRAFPSSAGSAAARAAPAEQRLQRSAGGSRVSKAGARVHCAAQERACECGSRACAAVAAHRGACGGRRPRLVALPPEGAACAHAKQRVRFRVLGMLGQRDARGRAGSARRCGRRSRRERRARGAQRGMRGPTAACNAVAPRARPPGPGLPCIATRGERRAASVGAGAHPPSAARGRRSAGTAPRSSCRRARRSANG